MRDLYRAYLAFIIFFNDCSLTLSMNYVHESSRLIKIAFVEEIKKKIYLHNHICMFLICAYYRKFISHRYSYCVIMTNVTFIQSAAGLCARRIIALSPIHDLYQEMRMHRRILTRDQSGPRLAV